MKDWGRNEGNWKEKQVYFNQASVQKPQGWKRDENIHFLDPVSEHSILSNRRHEQFSSLMRLRLLIGAWNRMLLLNRDHFPASCPTPQQCQQLFI